MKHLYTVSVWHTSDYYHTYYYSVVAYSKKQALFFLATSAGVHLGPKSGWYLRNTIDAEAIEYTQKEVGEVCLLS